MSNNLNAVLVLSDGTTFHGKSCGKIGTATERNCFQYWYDRLPRDIY